MPLCRILFIRVARPFVASLLAVLPALAIAAGPRQVGPLGADPAAIDARAKTSWARRLHDGLARERISGNEASYDARFYRLDLAIDPGNARMDGVVEMRATVIAGPLLQLDLDLVSSLTVTSATCGGAPAIFLHRNDLLSVTLDRPYANGETVDLVIRYGGDPSPGGAWAWDEKDGHALVWTVSEPYGAHTWWPCKDVAADKADSIEIRASAPTGMITASNGTLIASSDDGTRSFRRWREAHPIATYLVSIASYPYIEEIDWYHPSDADSMAIRFFIFPSDLEAAHAVNPLVKTMIGIYAGLFGEYPFLDEKYGEAECFFPGGMENQTCTSVGLFDEGLSAHELSHQWWGDMVTCRDFHHVWLNEGFASYSGALYEEAVHGREAYFARLDARKFFGPGTVYVPDDTDPGRIFDGNLSYAKASWVLHMLRHVLGDPAFFASLREYGRAQRYSVATTEDFRGVCESVTGRNLDWFFSEWIYGEYYPAYAYDWSASGGGTGYDVSLTLRQKQSWQIFRMPVDVAIHCDGGTETFTVLDSLPSQSFAFHVSSRPNGVKIDDGDWILKTVEEPVMDPSFDRGVLLVNGLTWSLAGEVRSCYEDRAFWGDYPIDFWDVFAAPDSGYPSTLPPPIGHGAVPSDVLGHYRNIVWVGNNVEGDLSAWSATSIESYLRAGGNLLLLTKQGDQFLGDPLRQYLGVSWAGGTTLYDCVAVYSALTDVARIGNQTLCPVFDLSLTQPDSRVIYKVHQNYDPERGIGVWRKPAAGGTWRPNGGQFVFLSGRPYRWNHVDLRTNVMFILRHFFGEPDLPGEVGDDPLAAPTLRLDLPARNPGGSGRTDLSFGVPRAGMVRLDILDAGGRGVRTLIESTASAGRHTVVWDHRDAAGRIVPAGVYLVRLQSPAGRASRKIVLIH